MNNWKSLIGLELNDCKDQGTLMETEDQKPFHWEIFDIWENLRGKRNFDHLSYMYSWENSPKMREFGNILKIYKTFNPPQDF